MISASEFRQEFFFFSSPAIKEPQQFHGRITFCCIYMPHSSGLLSIKWEKQPIFFSNCTIWGFFHLWFGRRGRWWQSRWYKLRRSAGTCRSAPAHPSFLPNRSLLPPPAHVRCFTPEGRGATKTAGQVEELSSESRGHWLGGCRASGGMVCGSR